MKSAGEPGAGALHPRGHVADRLHRLGVAAAQHGDPVRDVVLPDEIGGDFTIRYQAKYGKDAVALTAGMGYDSAHYLAVSAAVAGGLALVVGAELLLAHLPANPPMPTESATWSLPR